jgi:predicted PurR-regulated permease PerM
MKNIQSATVSLLTQNLKPRKNPSDMQPEEHLNQQLKKTALVLGWMLISAGILWALASLWPFFQLVARILNPFLFGLVVAYLFHPIVNLVQKRFKLGRVMGILIVAALVVTIVLAFFGLLLPILNAQTLNLLDALQTAIPKIVDNFSQNLRSPSAKHWWNNLNDQLKQSGLNLKDTFSKALAAVPSMMGGGAQALQGAAVGIAGIGAFFSKITGFIAMLLFAMVASFYYLLDFDKIPNLVRQLLPVKQENHIMDILGKVDTAVGGFLRGQIIDCALVGLLTTLGLFLVGMQEYAILIGAIAGAANFVPYLGPAIGATPALLWALLSPAHTTWAERGTSFALVATVFAIIQATDGLFFQPRIVGKNSNLHPLLVMFALATGAQFGLVGMVIAVPIACIARVLFLELWWKNHLEKRKLAIASFMAEKE